MKTPVLLLGFNRPDLSRRVLEMVRGYQPTKLYIAVDGPRSDRPEEVALVAEVRALVASVDWPCQVRTLFQETNRGLQDAVTAAITWFFSEMEEGIILEDDCLPTADFFRFCEELLPRYRGDTRILSICGEGYAKTTDASYSFSQLPLVWGWATWRRAWALYDPKLSDYEKLFQSGWFTGYFGGADRALYWKGCLDQAATKRVSSWGYRWLFTHWVNNALAIMPTVNTVSNHGFGPRGTHTTGIHDARSKRATEPLVFPLRHPPTVKRDFALETALNTIRFHIRPPKKALPRRRGLR